MCQKFGAYNTYWKRTLREIEQGRYVRDLQKVKRKVEQNGEDLPEELLVKLPKLVQDRIRRERARLARNEAAARGVDLGTLEQDSIAFSRPRPTVHEISEEDTLFDDADIDNLFGAVREQSFTGPLPVPEPEPAPKPIAAPAPKPVAPPPPRPVVPPRPIVPASVTSKLKTMTPPAGVPTKSTAPLVPPPLKPVAPPMQIPKPAAAPPPAAARPAPPPVPPGMSEKQCRELHARYTKARELVGDRSEVSYEKLLTTLNKQAPAIMKEHGAKAVDFQVVVRGDKVVLKAKPVK
jgi:hypothetical protein